MGAGRRGLSKDVSDHSPEECIWCPNQGHRAPDSRGFAHLQLCGGASAFQQNRKLPWSLPRPGTKVMIPLVVPRRTKVCRHRPSIATCCLRNPDLNSSVRALRPYLESTSKRFLQGSAAQQTMDRRAVSTRPRLTIRYKQRVPVPATFFCKVCSWLREVRPMLLVIGFVESDLVISYCWRQKANGGQFELVALACSGNAKHNPWLRAVIFQCGEFREEGKREEGKRDITDIHRLLEQKGSTCTDHVLFTHLYGVTNPTPIFPGVRS